MSATPAIIQNHKQQSGLCLPHGLLYGQDYAVAAWTWNQFELTRMPVDAAVGIVRNNQIVGSILFQHFSGHNVEFSYYGPLTPSVGIARAAAQYAIQRFNIDRVTARTNRKNRKIIRFLSAIGFRSEGMQKRYYGPHGDAVSMVMFREDLQRVAGAKS